MLYLICGLLLTCLFSFRPIVSRYFWSIRILEIVVIDDASCSAVQCNDGFGGA